MSSSSQWKGITRSREESGAETPVANAAGVFFSPRPGRRRRQGWSTAQSASEPLPSWDDSSDPQAFHHNPAQRPGPPLHYQWSDYAPLQSRPPCLRSLIAAISAVAAAGSCIMRASWVAALHTGRPPRLGLSLLVDRESVPGWDSLPLLDDYHIPDNCKLNPFVPAADHRLVQGQSSLREEERPGWRPSSGIELSPIEAESSRQDNGLDDEVAGGRRDRSEQARLNLAAQVRVGFLDHHLGGELIPWRGPPEVTPDLGEPFENLSRVPEV
jgi:hypothetical protein